MRLSLCTLVWFVWNSLTARTTSGYLIILIACTKEKVQLIRYFSSHLLPASLNIVVTMSWEECFGNQTVQWCRKLASFPGLPVLVLRFVFRIIHGNRRAAINGEGLGTLIMWMTLGGRRWGGGMVPDYKYVHNKPESEFHTAQAEYSQSCERQGSCLATEC